MRKLDMAGQTQQDGGFISPASPHFVWQDYLWWRGRAPRSRSQTGQGLCVASLLWEWLLAMQGQVGAPVQFDWSPTAAYQIRLGNRPARPTSNGACETCSRASSCGEVATRAVSFLEHSRRLRADRAAAADNTPCRRQARECRGDRRFAGLRQGAKAIWRGHIACRQLQRVRARAAVVGGLLSQACCRPAGRLQTVCTRVRFGAVLLQTQR